MKKSLQIPFIIFTFSLILLVMGTAFAQDDDNQSQQTGHHLNNAKYVKTGDLVVKSPPELRRHSIYDQDNLLAFKKSVTPGTGCCSILLHVSSGNDVFGFRRDSSYAASLYFTQSNWYGKDTLKEYKMVNGYFFHTIIAKDGWIASCGGPDIPYLNRQLEDIAGRASVSGSITSNTINSAKRVLWSMGMGHFLIKAPNDQVGIVIYNGGTISSLFKMADGQYVSVPNSPSCYRNGYASTDNPVASVVNLALSDRWGVNRRNVITYQISKEPDLINYSTAVNVYASRTRMSDNIYFGGGVIYGSSLPRPPNYRNIGKVILKNNETIPTGLAGSLYSLGK